MDVAHCLTKIDAIAREGDDSRRRVFQLGYNLGRLAEGTGLGREATWDRWRGPVSDWDRPTLIALAADLRHALRLVSTEGREGPETSSGTTSGPGPCGDDTNLPN